MRKLDPFQRPEHWHLLVFYFNRNDPRVIVPKRSGLGWTLNFAKPMAVPSLVIMITAVLAPLEILDRFGIDSHNVRGLVIIADIIGLMAFCSWRADPKRYLKDLDVLQNHE